MRGSQRTAGVLLAVLAIMVGLVACSGGVGPTGPKATEQAQQNGEAPQGEDTSGGTTTDAGGDATLSGACLEISQAMSSASSEMGTAIQDGLTNPEGVKDALLLQAEALQKAVTATANGEVKTALQAVADDMSAFADVFQGLPDMTNPSSWANDPVALEKVTQLGQKLQTAGTELQASLSELLTLCNYTP